MRPAEKLLNELRPYIVSREPNPKGEWRMRCPLHGDDKRPSASANINEEKGKYGVWSCRACGQGGSLRSLVKEIELLEEGSDEDVAAYDPFEDVPEAELTSSNGARSRLKESEVIGWHQHLLDDGERLIELEKVRGLSEQTIVRYAIGFDERSGRYTIPVYDENGMLVNVRRYLMGGDKGQKMWNMPGHGSPARLFPLANLEGDKVLVVEGELDALVATQHGFPAVSGTGGAGVWDPKWSALFTGKDVVVCYDNDKEGRIASKKVAHHLSPHAASVRIIDKIVPTPKGDLTDFFLDGGTPAKLRKKIKAARSYSQSEDEPEDSVEPSSVRVIGSMDSRTNGVPLAMDVMITGRRNPTYSVPKKVRLSCDMNAGTKCKSCPMMLHWEGEHDVDIQAKDTDVLSRFIDATESQTLEAIRKYIGAMRCQRLKSQELENQTVEEIFVMSNLDQSEEEETDYTQRRIYNVGTYDTRTNTSAHVVGTTVPNPRDRRNEFFSWDLRESVTSIDKFVANKEMRERLLPFQTSSGQRPMDKCQEIARDLSSNVTKIIGRERLHIAMDLVWHSLLHFPLDGKIISRGWLEFLVVGDTRTGKSETAIRLARHYQLGHVIGCEGATFAGLVGGVKQVGNSWTVQWGEVTINDRRLVVLDEASGLSTELIAQLSDVRSRGMAQITKIETQQTRARTRMIWISNPRKGKGVDEKRLDGIDVIEDLVGNPEDIARFDFAMSVSMNDVASNVINSPTHRRQRHLFTSDLCRDLVLWSWSRKPDQVVWRTSAYRRVYELAERMGNRYIDHPPLVQRTNVREKIARLSVALAARTFSTDSSGELLIVERRHVDDAVRFLDKLYSYDNFGYLRVSKRTARNRKTAQRNTVKIKKYLKGHPRLLEFLLDRRGSFRSQDLEEMAHMQRDEVNNALGTLSEAKMISKEKSQIIIEPELHHLLKEIEDE